MKRVLLSSMLVLLAACVTAPETRPDDGSTDGGPTPDVPEQTRTGTPQTGDNGGSDVVKPPPAKAAEGAGPAAVVFDSGTQNRFKQGVAALNSGNTDEAERAFKDVVGRNDKAAYAWANLGVIAERKNQPDEAARSYRKATEVDPGQDIAWDYLARLECRQKRCSQVENETRAAVSKNPALIGPRNALVYSLIAQNKLDAAAVEAKKVLKSDERNVRAMQLLAQVYFKEGKVELARLVLENARAIDTNDPATHNAMGLVLLQLKQKPQALESFRQAALLKPDFAEARNNFGALLNDGNDFESAVKELESAVAAEPDFTLAHLNLGNAYRGLQQPQKAIAEYQLVQKARPELADTSFNLGVTYLDLEIPGTEPTDRYRQAITHFNQYKEKGGKDDRVDTYLKDATKAIEKEERRKEREKKDQLKKAQKSDEDAKKKAAEEEAAKKAAANPPPPSATPPAEKPADASKKTPAKNPPAQGNKLGEDDK